MLNNQMVQPIKSALTSPCEVAPWRPRGPAEVGYSLEGLFRLRHGTITDLAATCCNPRGLLWDQWSLDGLQSGIAWHEKGWPILTDFACARRFCIQLFHILIIFFYIFRLSCVYSDLLIHPLSNLRSQVASSAFSARIPMPAASTSKPK